MSTTSYTAARRTRAARAALLTLALASAAAAVDAGGLVGFLEDHVARPLSFVARRALDRDPELDPRLKFLVLDDIVVRNQKLTDLSLRSWGSVLKGLAAERPRMVLIDKVFETPLRSSDTQAFVETLRELPMPVVVAGFAQSQEIVGRPPLDLSRPELARTRYQRGPVLPAWLAAQALRPFPYGPNPDFIAAFRMIGHIHGDGELRYPAFLRPTEDSLMPHLSLHAAREVLLLDDDLVVDGQKVPLDRAGRMIVNLVPTPRLDPAKVRLDVAIDHMTRGEDLEAIRPDDVVLVLPLLFTGGGDRKETVFGSVPGGYMIASLVNSVLTGKWIATPSAAQSGAIVWLLTAGAGLAGASLPTLAGAVLVTLLAGLISAGGLLLFAYASWSSPWVFYAMAASVAGYGNVILRAWIMARDARRVTDALGGLVAPSEIGELLRNPQRLDLRPRNVRVTVMFIDLVGFSRLAETVPAEELFLQLKVVLSEMRRIIHQHAGFIDRSIGDGLLCFFGYRPDGSPASAGHADEALQCAIELQRRNLDMSLEAKKNGSVSYPMRIGLNTEVVCMGDLGDNDKIDFTVIGRGVNFAKRLESACDHFRIMLSVSTRKALTKGAFDETCLHERFVQVKHHSELLPAYEYDPLFGLGAEKIEALQHFWALIGMQRKDARHGLDDRLGVELKSPHGRGFLVNFSESGLAVLLDRYIACGAPIAFDIEDDGSPLAAQCRQRGLLPLQVEVRWGEVTPDGYLHGVTIKSASDESRRWLFETLQRLATDRGGRRSA